MSEDFVETAECYRIRKAGKHYQPEMEYICRDGKLWVPLGEDGCWADANAYSTGKVTRKTPMSEDAAKLAVWRARLINKVHR